MDLHDFWDTALIDQRAGSWQYLVGQLSEFPPVQADSNWSPAMVNDWTNESHKLAKEQRTRPQENIDQMLCSTKLGAHATTDTQSGFPPGIDHQFGVKASNTR